MWCCGGVGGGDGVRGWVCWSVGVCVGEWVSGCVEERVCGVGVGVNGVTGVGVGVCLLACLLVLLCGQTRPGHWLVYQHVWVSYPLHMPTAANTGTHIIHTHERHRSPT